ncbi:MAG: CARDB domain-containing protein [Acidobacteriota bacterium]
MKFDEYGSTSWKCRFPYVRRRAGSYGLSQTSDGGYITCGFMNDRYSPQEQDAWVRKLSPDGDIEWQWLYGGPGGDSANDIRQTADAGYIIAGSTIVSGTTRPDAWVVKTDGSGKILWQYRYGGPGNDAGRRILPTSDGGYLLLCRTRSYGSGANDIWVIKLDSSGNVVWQNSYGGALDDLPADMILDSDNGCVIAGVSSSFGKGDLQLILMSLSSSGRVGWQKTYEADTGLLSSYLPSLSRVPGDGPVLAGHFAGAHTPDVRVLSLTSSGIVNWMKPFPGSYSSGIAAAPNGGVYLSSNVSPGPLGLCRMSSAGKLPIACDILTEDMAIVSSPISVRITETNTQRGQIDNGAAPLTGKAVLSEAASADLCLFADLVARWDYLDRQGSTVSGRVVCTNDGTRWTRTGFDVAIYLSEDDALDDADELVRTYYVSPLRVGESSPPLDISFSRTGPLQGKYLIASVDHTKKVVESNEGNNVIAREIP